MTFSLAERVGYIHYAIREFIPLAKQLEKKGKRIIYLNVGDPLKFDFDTPQIIKDALYEAVVRGHNYYSLSEGDEELREAIAEKERRVNKVDISAEDVVVTQGVSEAINFILAVLVDKDDEVLLPGPVYPLYEIYTRIYGGKPIFYKCDEKNQWMPDVNDIREKVSKKTKAIVIINPNNPTGSLYDKHIIEEILDIASENDIIVISDEIYDRIVFEGEFVSTASLAKDTTVIGLNGFSKVYLMTGWRLGYLYVKDPTNEKRDKILNALHNLARTRLSACTPVQKAGIIALKKAHEHIPQLVSKLRKRRDYVYRRLKEIEYFDVCKPKGAFYIFPRIPVSKYWKNDREFVKKLLIEEGVLVVHGSGFGAYGDNHIRIVLLPPVEILKEALDKIESFMRKHLRN